MGKKRYIKNSKGVTMSVTTDTLGLEKPLLNENYDIDVHNRNMDKIDEDLKPIDDSYIIELFQHDGDTTNPRNYYTKEEADNRFTTKEEFGNLSQLQTSNKSNLVNAINEVFQSANNGKELIANAIGEPVSADDTFSAMSNDINGLLSTFKVNMMNNGVTVESGDKFKSLIDKITTMSEEGSGKGIQYAEGDYTRTEDFLASTTNVSYDLNFTPTFVLLKIGAMVETSGNYNLSNIWVSNLNQTTIPSKNGNSYSYKLQLTNVTDSSFDISNNSYYSLGYMSDIKWYAIGVGEEDTTYRDSLASVLQGAGIDTTGDDMATLIVKVEELITRNKNSEVLHNG